MYAYTLGLLLKYSYLLRKPRTEEGHVISVCVRMDSAERIRADCSQKSENAPGELRTNYIRYKTKLLY